MDWGSLSCLLWYGYSKLITRSSIALQSVHFRWKDMMWLVDLAMSNACPMCSTKQHNFAGHATEVCLEAVNTTLDRGWGRGYLSSNEILVRMSKCSAGSLSIVTLPHVWLIWHIEPPVSSLCQESPLQLTRWTWAASSTLSKSGL